MHLHNDIIVMNNEITQQRQHKGIFPFMTEDEYVFFKTFENLRIDSSLAYGKTTRKPFLVTNSELVTIREMMNVYDEDNNPTNLIAKRLRPPYDPLSSGNTSMDSEGSNSLQGIVKRTKFRKEYVLMKRSKCVDYAIENEIRVLNMLQKTGTPHFCKFYGSDRKRSLPRVFMSIVDGVEFHKELQTSQNPTDLLGCVYQTLAAVAIMNSKEIVHNDLHSSNVMIVESDIVSDVHVYDFGYGKKFEIVTNGYYPIIIDYGFASVHGKKLYAPMFNTHLGYYPFGQDGSADPRRFLGCVATTMRRLKKNRTSEMVRFYDSVKQMYEGMNTERGLLPYYTFPELITRVKEVLFRPEWDKIVQDDMELGLLNPDLGSEFDDAIGLFFGKIRYPIVSQKKPFTFEQVEIKYAMSVLNNITISFLNACNKENRANLANLIIFHRFRNEWIKTRKIYDFKHDTEEMILLKNVINCGVSFLTKRYGKTVPNIVELKHRADRVVEVLPYILNREIQTMIKEKNKFYKKIENMPKNAIDALDKLKIEPVTYIPGMKVTEFDCVNNTDPRTYVIGRNEAEYLNSRNVKKTENQTTE